jgi:hypothetical protein
MYLYQKINHILSTFMWFLKKFKKGSKKGQKREGGIFG